MIKLAGELRTATSMRTRYRRQRRVRVQLGRPKWHAPVGLQDRRPRVRGRHRRPGPHTAVHRIRGRA